MGQDGGVLAAGFDTQVRIFDAFIEGETSQREVLTGHTDSITQMKVIGADRVGVCDVKTIVTSSFDGSLLVWYV